MWDTDKFRMALLHSPLIPDCVLDDEARRAREIHKIIEDDIRKAKKEKEHKLLLLGAGEAGKSTFVKQMKFLYKEGGLDQEERHAFKRDIIDNVKDSVIILITGMETLNIDYEKESTLKLVPFLLNFDHNDDLHKLDSKFGGLVSDLWKDQGIKQCFGARGKEIQIPDSASHFLDSAERISLENYIPSDEDILLSRKQTTGIVEYVFKMDKLPFTLVDVGGQRGERKKWMHCFNEVTAILFLVALSEYDQVLWEDASTNRMIESVRLFKEIINNPWFKDIDIILFLNKEDLFNEKIERVDLSDFFPMYTGPKKNAAEGKAFIKDMFLGVNEDPLREIHPFTTVAISKENTRKVFVATKVIILKENPNPFS